MKVEPVIVIVVATIMIVAIAGAFGFAIPADVAAWLDGFGR